jgi:hypothetical protein
MAKGCLQTQYKITMWEDIGVHDMDQTRPHKLQSPLHKTCGSTQSCVPIDPCHDLQSYPGREIVRRGHKGLIMIGLSLEVHYKIIHYGLHGFNLHPWAYNGVAK